MVFTGEGPEYDSFDREFTMQEEQEIKEPSPYDGDMPEEDEDDEDDEFYDDDDEEDDEDEGVEPEDPSTLKCN